MLFQIGDRVIYIGHNHACPNGDDCNFYRPFIGKRGVVVIGTFLADERRERSDIFVKFDDEKRSYIFHYHLIPEAVYDRQR